MKDKSKTSQKLITLDLEFSNFNIPPSGDGLILGKKAPIGPQAAKIMLDTVSPGQFKLFKIDHKVIDAILIKKYLYLRVDKDLLLETLINEAQSFMSEDCMVVIRCDVKLYTKKELKVI